MVVHVGVLIISTKQDACLYRDPDKVSYLSGSADEVRGRFSKGGARGGAYSPSGSTGSTQDQGCILVSNDNSEGRSVEREELTAIAGPTTT
jgi:hypothetical protein